MRGKGLVFFTGVFTDFQHLRRAVHDRHFHGGCRFRRGPNWLPEIHAVNLTQADASAPLTPALREQTGTRAHVRTGTNASCVYLPACLEGMMGSCIKRTFHPAIHDQGMGWAEQSLADGLLNWLPSNQPPFLNSSPLFKGFPNGSRSWRLF